MGKPRHQKGALPTFNEDGPFAVRLLAIIVSIYLSVKRDRPAGVPQKAGGASALESVGALPRHCLFTL